MHKENEVYIHNEVLFKHEKNEIMTLAEKWMKLVIIMLIKKSQT
jgi:hypothetical protein